MTTTPRAVPLVQRLIGQAGDGSVAITGGTTFDNEANLSSRFLEAIQSDFGHSLLARQEIGGELVTDTEGALWTRTMIEDARDEATIRHDARVIVAVDPPASSTGDECGIIVAAIDDQGIGSILADRSIANPQPSDWAKAVASAAKEWEADCVIAEANQGGEMVESVLRSVNSALPIKLVRASRGKVARAEPIAALYSAGRVKHRGQFPQLEDQMCGFLVGGGFAGPGRSPDRADALVWALSELMLSPQSRPGVRAI